MSTPLLPKLLQEIAWLSAHFWYVGRLELDIIWDQVPAASAVQTEPLNPSSASEWRVHVIDPAHAQPYGHSVFSLSVSYNTCLDGIYCAPSMCTYYKVSFCTTCTLIVHCLQ